MAYSSIYSSFGFLPDGTILARNGTQANCGGIAKIHVRISLNSAKGITFRASDHDGEHDEGYGMAVPGAYVPVEFREAVFKGAQDVFEESTRNSGVCFELLDAFVHMVDARESRFEAAGKIAVREWLKQYADGLNQMAENNQQEA